MSRGLDLIGFLGRRTRASIRSDGSVLLTAIDRTYWDRIRGFTCAVYCNLLQRGTPGVGQEFAPMGYLPEFIS
jgi:hypothetical protein